MRSCASLVRSETRIWGYVTGDIITRMERRIDDLVTSM